MPLFPDTVKLGPDPFCGGRTEIPEDIQITIQRNSTHSGRPQERGMDWLHGACKTIPEDTMLVPRQHHLCR
jgi:hypothetical protein